MHKNESGHFVWFEDMVKHVFEEGRDSLMMDVLNGDSDGVFVVRFTVRHHYHQFSLQVSYCIV